MEALIIVDVQNDFCPGGALAVPEGDRVIPIINRLEDRFELVVATQDWHPPDHGSFAANHPGREPGEVIELAGLEQILWPVHCVQKTKGAEFHPDLRTDRIAKVFHKATDPEIDSYSAFYDNGHRKSTGLGEYLKDRGVADVFIAGLATDYCVKFSALDSLKLGFGTHVIEEACRGIDREPGDSARAIEKIKARGAKIASFA